jgi:hypothetical protein
MRIRNSYDDLPSFEIDPFHEAEQAGQLARIVEQARITKRFSGGKKLQTTVYVVGVNSERTILYSTAQEVLINQDRTIKGVSSWVADTHLKLEDIERYEILATAEEIFRASF